MAFYTVLIPPPGSGGTQEEVEKARLLPERFVWTGLYFSILWLLAKRLWLASLLAALVYAGLFYARSRFGLSPGGFVLAHLAIGLFVALEGNNLIARKLARKGWRLADVVEARTLPEAERRFFERALSEPQAMPRPASAPASRPSAGPVPIIGLFPEARGR